MDMTIVETIHRFYPDVQALYLFGSYGTEYERADSDVDLVNLRLVNTVFQNEIINTGRLISTTEQNAVDEFEMLTLSLYQKPNEERADILGQIIQTKRIYNL